MSTQYNDTRTYTCTQDIISSPLLVDADTGFATRSIAIPRAAESQAILNVDKFPYTRKQTNGNESIPCPRDVYRMLERFHCFQSKVIL